MSLSENGQPVFESFAPGGLALVVGSTGGIGQALLAQLQTQACFDRVMGLGRSSNPPMDLCDEATVAAAADHVARVGSPLRLLINAAGFLHGEGVQPEKALRQLNADDMAKSFAINAIGPALLMKHFLPLLARDGKAVFATLSAKVGSIGDNHLGGWYSYRASKAALNQLVKTAAIECSRSHAEAICVALHPGTVSTPLSKPFAKSGLAVQTPEAAAARLLATIDQLGVTSTGGFFDASGHALPW